MGDEPVDEAVPLMSDEQPTMRQRQQKFKAEADAVRERIKNMKFPKRRDYGMDGYGGRGGYGDDYDEPPTMAFYCGLFLLVIIFGLLGVVFFAPHLLESAQEEFDDGF